ELVGAAALGPPMIDVSSWHQLWPITDAAAIERVTAAVADETVIIADGHHRYETALAYRDEQQGNEAARYVLAYLANMEEEGVVILPTHRLVPGPLSLEPAVLEARLRERFTVEPLPAVGRRSPGEIDCLLPHRRGFPAEPPHDDGGAGRLPGRRADAREVDLLLPEAGDGSRLLARRSAVGVTGRMLKNGIRGGRGRGVGRGAPPIAFGSVAWKGARSRESLVRDLTGGARGCPAPHSPCATGMGFSASCHRCAAGGSLRFSSW